MHVFYFYVFKFLQHPVNMYLVEIRQSGNGFIILPSSNHICPKEQYESSIINTIDKINDITKKWLDPSTTIILMILSPIPRKNRGVFAKKTANHIKKIYMSKSWKLGQKIFFQIETKDIKLPTVNIEALLINSVGNPYRAIQEIIAPSFQSTQPVLQSSLTDQAFYVLSSAIAEKTNKLGLLEGEKWLVLINTHPLLDYSLYSEAYKKISSQKLIKRFFSKNFFIDKLVKELIFIS